MQSEERFGLTKRHSYDEIVKWIKSDPKGVPYPDRVAFKTYDSPVYAQLRDSLKVNTEPQEAYAAYQHGGGLAPFVPPRPRFVEPPPGNSPTPPGDDDDDMMGPPGPGPERYTTLLEPATRPTDQILINEGMSPAPPPPPPPPPTMVQQAGDSFAQAAGNAAGGALGTAAATAASVGVGALLTRAAAAAGMGAMEGAEAGPAGILAGSAIGLMGSLIGDAVGGAVRRGFQPGGGSNQQPAGPPTAYGPGGLRERVQSRPQETINRQQHSHNQGTGAPTAQVDFRTLNGQNERKPKDRKVRFNNEVAEDRIGTLGGASGSSSGPMVVSGSGTSRQAAPLDTGSSAKISRNADPAPAAAPSYKDLVGKLKKAKAPEVKPFANPVTSSRPRERSPPRGDRRPLEAQRKSKKDSAALFPGGDGREEALSRRSKTIPKNSGPKAFYIGDQGERRKADTDIYSRAKPAQPAAPKQGTKRKAVAPPSAAIEQDRKRPAPKPQGRLAPKDGDRKIGKPRTRK